MTIEDAIVDIITVELSSKNLYSFSYRIANYIPDGYNLRIKLLERKDRY